MDNQGNTDAEGQPDRRSRGASPAHGTPNARESTPTDSDLARALLSLSFTPQQQSTPLISRPTSSQLPGSYPETSALPRHLQPPVNDDSYHTPVRDPHVQSFAYPDLASYSSSP